MMNANFEAAKKEGVDIGTLVEVTLKSGAKFNVQTSTVPAYHAPEKDTHKPSDKRYVGFVAVMNEQYVGILPGWNDKLRKNPEPGHIGGVHFDWDAIYSYMPR